MRQVTGEFVLTVALWTAALALIPASDEVAAQGIPSRFTNLSVLPEDISRREIVGIMRQYVDGVGGGTCSYCHMVSDGLDQPTDDFASDEKATKRKARVMMEMVRHINTTSLASLPDRQTPNVTVTCRTCHGGITRPEAIDAVVSNVLDQEGIGPAVASYLELRDQYVGTRAYDFGPGPLNSLAERLGRERAAQGVRLLELNVEFHPTYLPALILLGNMHEANEDDESAVRVYRDILELPADLQFYEFYAGRARERIAAIGGG